MKRVFKNQRKIVFDTCLRVVKELGLDVTHASNKRGIINAETQLSLWSWGENIQIKIREKSPNETEVMVESDSIGQLIDWGKNESNEMKIITQLGNALKQ